MKPTTMQQGHATEIDAFGVNKARPEHEIATTQWVVVVGGFKWVALSVQRKVYELEALLLFRFFLGIGSFVWIISRNWKLLLLLFGFLLGVGSFVWIFSGNWKLAFKNGELRNSGFFFFFSVRVFWEFHFQRDSQIKCFARY